MKKTINRKYNGGTFYQILAMPLGSLMYLEYIDEEGNLRIKQIKCLSDKKKDDFISGYKKDESRPTN